MHYGETHNQRIKNICQILLEMADGNFSYRIPRSKEDDTLETMTVLINWLAEEMQESLFHRGYVNPHTSYEHLVQSVYILDEKDIIKDFSPQVPGFLEIQPNKILGMGFSQLLEKNSQADWQKAKKQLMQNKTGLAVLLLNFCTSKNLLAPAHCNALKLSRQNKIMLSSFNVVIQEEKATAHPSQKNVLSLQGKNAGQPNSQLIQSVYDYILLHKDSSIPTIKNLAKIFGTNEFKLKTGFRFLFKTSIYRFYTDVRLKRALLLIKNTGIPLKEIAFMSGYNTYPNFSRAFKIKYKCTPGSIRKRLP